MYTELILHWVGRAARGLLDICVLAPPLLRKEDGRCRLPSRPFSLCRPAPSATCLVWLGRGHEGDHHRGPQFTDCVRMVHFMRNLLGMVGHALRKELGTDLRTIFAAASRKQVLALASEIAQKWRGRGHEKVAEHLEEHIEECLTCLAFPESYQRRIRTTNGLERLNQEIKRRTRVVRIFPNRRRA